MSRAMMRLNFMRMRCAVAGLVWLVAACAGRAGEAEPLVLLIGDQHSAYERTA